ncbi:MAG: hypothetical protein EOM30_05300 [Clostridia bacterium]|nr:hypothetical protein [Clostridia bacterium]
MEQPISLKIENTKGKILNAVNMAGVEYNLPAFIMEGILSSVLAEIRSQAKIEMLNDFNAMIDEQNKKEKEGEE